jgi:DNA-binding NarL/FixJ family response regulator
MIVVLTSSPTDKERFDSYDLGVNSYITKPVSFDAFTKAISQIGLYWGVMNEPPKS